MSNTNPGSPLPAHHENDIAISVSNLSKCYQIYNQPQDRLKQTLYPRLQRLAGKTPKQYYREFRVLNDDSFEIKKGKSLASLGVMAVVSLPCCK